jgi:YHS domain-containing protein
MYRDPVCGMVLDNTAKFKITYEGETYHFAVSLKEIQEAPDKIH